MENPLLHITRSRIHDSLANLRGWLFYFCFNCEPIVQYAIDTLRSYCKTWNTHNLKTIYCLLWKLLIFLVFFPLYTNIRIIRFLLCYCSKVVLQLLDYNSSGLIYFSCKKQLNFLFYLVNTIKMRCDFAWIYPIQVNTIFIVNILYFELNFKRKTYTLPLLFFTVLWTLADQ